MEKIRIPDQDIPHWIKALHSGGFSSEEIDSVLENLNLTYRKAKEPELIERKIEAIKKYYKDRYNRILSSEEIDYFRQGIEEELEKLSS